MPEAVLPGGHAPALREKNPTTIARRDWDTPGDREIVPAVFRPNVAEPFGVKTTEYGIVAALDFDQFAYGDTE